MLCQFTFENFKSYRDETVFDMQAANIEEFSDSLIPPPCGRFTSLLPVSAIFGPNAGGKSNLFEALAYLISRVLMPIKASTGYQNPYNMLLNRYTPFLLDDASRKAPTEFSISFRTKAAQYHYHLSLVSDEIKSEALSYIKLPCQRRRSVVLFERTANEIKPGPALRRANSQQINAEIPYLSFLAINYSIPEIEDAVRWFKNCYVMSYAVSGIDHSFSASLDSPHVKPLVLSILSGMDIPVSDYEIQEEPAGEGRKKRQIMTIHSVKDRSYRLDLESESEGTIKILSVLPAVVLSLAAGGPLFVDELDAKLHPQLLRYLVRLYTDPRRNDRRAQLIFTCHDLSIMKNDLLRRDEIWFAARNEESASELWSLYDLRDEKGERVKNTAAYDRQYLAGRYGADPYLKQILNWEAPDGEEAEAT